MNLGQKFSLFFFFCVFKLWHGQIVGVYILKQSQAQLPRNSSVKNERTVFTLVTVKVIPVDLKRIQDGACTTPGLVLILIRSEAMFNCSRKTLTSSSIEFHVTWKNVF